MNKSKFAPKFEKNIFYFIEIKLNFSILIKILITEDLREIFHCFFYCWQRGSSRFLNFLFTEIMKIRNHGDLDY